MHEFPKGLFRAFAVIALGLSGIHWPNRPDRKNADNKKSKEEYGGGAALIVSKQIHVMHVQFPFTIDLAKANKFGRFIWIRLNLQFH